MREKRRYSMCVEKRTPQVVSVDRYANESELHQLLRERLRTQRRHRQ
jgi:hypothetical protein